MAGLREGPHLVARFADVLSARPLRPAEQQAVAELLDSDAERTMFWTQSAADQRHGWASARHVQRTSPERRDLARAALLHDVGKRHARLGVIGRVIASLIRMFGGRGSGRIGDYIDHGARAAGELAEGGAEPIVVAFARAHHDARPDDITEADWALLMDADKVRR